MLYVFVGDDVVAVRHKVHSFFEREGIVNPERVTAESYATGLMGEYAHATSLFGTPAPVLFDFILEHDEAEEALMDYAEALGASERLCVVMDTKPKAALQKVFKKHAAEYRDIAGTSARERFNTFILTDAFLQKDKKSLWVLLQRARAAGVSAEEIVGTLFWQVKAMRLAHTTASAAEAGMKDFTYRKARAGARVFSEEELRLLSRKLLTLYHDGHAGSDMDIGIERFVLSL